MINPRKSRVKVGTGELASADSTKSRLRGRVVRPEDLDFAYIDPEKDFHRDVTEEQFDAGVAENPIDTSKTYPSGYPFSIDKTVYGMIEDGSCIIDQTSLKDNADIIYTCTRQKIFEAARLADMRVLFEVEIRSTIANRYWKLYERSLLLEEAIFEYASDFKDIEREIPFDRDALSVWKQVIQNDLLDKNGATTIICPKVTRDFREILRGIADISSKNATDCRTGKPGKVWDNMFVEQMSLEWSRLTGLLPDRSNHFKVFIKSAFASIYEVVGKHPPKRSDNYWNSSIARTVRLAASASEHMLVKSEVDGAHDT